MLPAKARQASMWAGDVYAACTCLLPLLCLVIVCCAGAHESFNFCQPKVDGRRILAFTEKTPGARWPSMLAAHRSHIAGTLTLGVDVSISDSWVRDRLPVLQLSLHFSAWPGLMPISLSAWW